MRDKIDRVNQERFTVAKSMAESVWVDNDLITIHHTCGRQQNRDNSQMVKLIKPVFHLLTI